MYYSSKESAGKKYITYLVWNANLGAIVSGIFFVNFNACAEQVIAGADSLDERASTILYFQFLASLVFGGVLGGLISSSIANNLGRRKAMMIADVITIIGCLVTIHSSFAILLLGRLICGVALGLNIMVIPLYVREISPPELSGKIGSSFRICFTIGLLLPFICTLEFLLEDPPKIIFALVFRMPCLFALARLISFVKWVHLDTPQFYIDKNQDGNAIMALEKILDGDRVEHIYHREKKFEIKGIRGVFGPKYKKQAMLIMLLIFASEFMGANSIILTDSVLFSQAGFDGSRILSVLNIIMGFSRLLSAVLGSILLEQIGRKRLFLSGILLSIFLIFPIIFLANAQTLQVATIMFYSIWQGLTISLVLPIYASELLPPSGVALQVVFQMVCLLVSTLLCYLAAGTVFFIYGLVGFATIYPISKLAKETKGKTLNEVCMMFQPDTSRGLLDTSFDEDASQLEGLNVL